MRMMAIASILITLPAIVVVIVGIVMGRPFMIYAAGASFVLNSLPFVIAMLLMRGQKQDTMDHH
jgi:hypothetical protein